MANKETVKSMNPETGELEDLYLWFDDKIPKDGSVKFSGYVTENPSYRNLQLYKVPNKDRKKKTLFGEEIKSIVERRKYSKVYQVAVREINFSQWSYEALWFRLICNLYKNSNIIYRRMSNNNLTFIHTKTELMNLTNVSKKTFNKFYDECTDRDYIRILPEHEMLGKVYIVNPYYARNGFGLIESTYKLFRDIIDDLL